MESQRTTCKRLTLKLLLSPSLTGLCQANANMPMTRSPLLNGRSLILNTDHYQYLILDTHDVGSPELDRILGVLRRRK